LVKKVAITSYLERVAVIRVTAEIMIAAAISVLPVSASSKITHPKKTATTGFTKA
jgi:hypothetical protein